MIGTNWFLGFSHTSQAKDRIINETMTAKPIADILAVFMAAGVDTLYGMRPGPKLVQAVEMAEQRVGRECITLAIPSWPLGDATSEKDAARRELDALVELGVSICMPHQCVTDAFVNRRTQSLDGIEPFLAMIRERGMVPGLSTHMPETPVYADKCGLDVATYIQLYNAIGFMMQIEVEWVHEMIQRAEKPVIAIKPLAAGRITPLVGLSFAWSTIRDTDMIAIGTTSPYEAEEVIELSLALLEKRAANIGLSKTRSKTSLT